MAASAFASLIKYILGLFNFILVALSGVLIFFGARAMNAPDDIGRAIETPDKTAVFLVVIGVFLFLLSFMGCWGSFRENQCMLLTYGSTLSVILLIELVVGGVILGFKNDIDSAADAQLKRIIHQYNWFDQNSVSNKLVNTIQTQTKCCGAFRMEDFIEETGVNLIPGSCCDSPKIFMNVSSYVDHKRKPAPRSPRYPLIKSNSTTLDVYGCFPYEAYHQGCVPVIKNILGQYYGPLGGLIIGFAVVQLFGVLFACFFARSLRKEYENMP